MGAGLRVVGHAHPIIDASQKVTGRLVYASDLRLPGMLFARLLLSPIAHGTVTAIDSSAAAALPGVVGVFTAFDTPGTQFSRYRLVPGQRHCPADETLFSSRVRFVGDRVAAVVASSQETADEAVALLDVGYEPLPALLNPEESLAATQVRIHPGGNLLHEFELEFGEARPPSSDAVETNSSTTTQKIHHAALEPHVCFADYDAAGDLTVWTPTQGVFGARAMVADLLGLSYSRVRVIKLPMGGSFGGKQEFILEPVAAWLAKSLGRPVRLLFSREECMIATSTRPATSSTIRTTVSPEGVLQDLEVEALLDAGAYATSSIDNAEAMAHKLTRLYRIPHYRHRGRVAYTNSPVAGGARGWGAPEITTAAEIHLDLVARELGIDPVELRLRNLVHPHDVDPALGLSLGDARVIECLERGAAAFDWAARRDDAANVGRHRRGVGVACGAHRNGQLGECFADYSTMTLTLSEDGSLALNASLHEVGCGTLTAMRLIVAEVMGVDPELVAVREADTALTPYDYGTYGSRMTYVGGACAQATARALRQTILEAAADLLAVPAAGLHLSRGRATVTGDGGRGLSYGDIALRTKLERGCDLAVTHTHTADSNPGAYSVQFAEVDVDCATGLCRVTDFLAVADVGRAINRGMVEGQFQGAVQMGIGYALCEELAIDDLGSTGEGGLRDYLLVNAVDMPDVRVLLVEHEGDEGPFGAKSVGEIATVPTAAAVVNAVNHALGTSLSSLPLTPEKVVAAVAHAAPREVQPCV